MDKTSLLLLAAGMGSRYGGLKQLDGFGPNQETLMEYSIYDAIDAGFEKIVFIIRSDFEVEFRQRFIDKIDKNIEVRYAFQELDNIPAGFTVPKERIKPWGTAHAVLSAKDTINEPFAVINADDFYGRGAMEILHLYLSSRRIKDEKNYCVLGYPVEQTLSEHGAVSRGVCEIDKIGNLVELIERPKIERRENAIVYEEDGDLKPLPKDTLVSMNMMGFTPSFFHFLEVDFNYFLNTQIDDLKAEYILPGVVNNIVRQKRAHVKIIKTDSTWFGVTYPEDKQRVIKKINQMIAEGIYPSQLW
ncbi:MAG: sugar phosphate nucleotidyltransferase [Ignavibacteria bacterium]|nr:sugar phosphate nucleotidyltransferase [Ignavibacteria bacterium]